MTTGKIKFKPNTATLFVLMGGLGCILFLVIIINVAPYKVLIERLLQQTIDTAGAVFLFNWLTEKITTTIFWLLGFIFYLVVQLLELLPKIIKRNKNIMRNLLSESYKNAKYKPNRNDKGAVRSIKRSLNQTAIWALSHVEMVRTIMYVFDSIICYLAYPFVKSGNPMDLVNVILLGQWENLDYWNLFKFVLTVKGVEMLLDWIFAINDLRKASKSTTY